MKFLLINGKTIWKRFLTVLGSAFSALSVILSFRTWDEIGIKTFTAKVIIFFFDFSDKCSCFNSLDSLSN